MNQPPEMSPNVPPHSRLMRVYRLSVVMLLGFISGLPLALTVGAMQAWLTLEGLDLVTLGFLTLVGIPYTFKFLWAPLMDRFDLPWLGRRRGWIVLIQLLIALTLFGMAATSPSQHTRLFALIAVAVAFLSASLDIVIDAYRTDLLTSHERGLGSSLSVLGYRLAMVLSGGIAFVWAEQWGSWPKVYRIMALIMAAGAALCFFGLPRLKLSFEAQKTRAARELLGFLGLIVGVVIGAIAARMLLILLGFDSASDNRWIRLLFLFAQVIAGGACGLALGKRVGFDTLNRSLQSYFSMRGAWAFLALVVFYKIGDAFAVALVTPFLLDGMHFSQTEVGIANKTVGLAMTIFGAVAGGFILLKVRLSNALLAFGMLQLASNLGYYFLSAAGAGALGQIVLPEFNLLIVSTAQPTPIDAMLLVVICIDNFAAGLGTAALVALLMSLCNLRFSATHYALLSAFMSLGRVFVGPVAGVVADQVGWSWFFLISIVVAMPGLVLVAAMRSLIDAQQEDRDDRVPT